MRRFALFFICVLGLSGCASYQIPVQPECHPANPAIEGPSPQLSPILKLEGAAFTPRGAQ